MAKQGELGKTVNIPVDGNWFTISFDAIQVKEDRLVISAKHKHTGLITNPRDPTEKQYVVEFIGTRAAYLRGHYTPNHVRYGWPYIHWDIRSYATHPENKALRIYVKEFWANDEIKKLIFAMEGVYGTTNILNSYINDNLLRFQMGIRIGKTPQEIEKKWSNGLIESLGYRFVEAFDSGNTKGSWLEVKSHWCKHAKDLRA